MKTIFYFSRIVGNCVYSKENKVMGKVSDLIIEWDQSPKIVALNVKINGEIRTLDFSEIFIEKVKGQYLIKCYDLIDVKLSENTFLIGKQILDRQILNVNGQKLFRVNDLKLIIDNDIHLIAIDIGIEGLFRRLGIAKFLKKIKIKISNQYILWKEIETIGFGHQGIKILNEYTKVNSNDLINTI